MELGLLLLGEWSDFVIRDVIDLKLSNIFIYSLDITTCKGK